MKKDYNIQALEQRFKDHLENYQSSKLNTIKEQDRLIGFMLRLLLPVIKINNFIFDDLEIAKTKENIFIIQLSIVNTKFETKIIQCRINTKTNEKEFFTAY